MRSMRKFEREKRTGICAGATELCPYAGTASADVSPVFLAPADELQILILRSHDLPWRIAFFMGDVLPLTPFGPGR
jgi:hypothetical protein